MDVVGWITDGSAPDTARGLYVPLAPRRVSDSRVTGAFSRGELRAVDASGGVLPGRVSAIVANASAPRPAPTQTSATMARGREMVEKLLQREGKTAIKLEDLATQLGFKSAESLFEVVGKDEFSLRAIEAVWRPAAPALESDELLLQRMSRHSSAPARSGVLVVGVDSLLTQLARCCKPAPPDEIRGFVTRGKGVSIHRLGCPSLGQLLLRQPGRDIDVEWGKDTVHEERLYPVDVQVIAQDRPTLLRDISEVFAREKMPVTGVQSQVVKGQALMTFTVQTPDTRRLSKVLANVCELKGVRVARRR